MAFWSRFFGPAEGITPNANGPESYSPGDPNGVHYDPPAPIVSIEQRSVQASPWDGWPAEWATPNWTAHPGIAKLVDTAWACLDLNSSVLATMPVYRTKNGVIEAPLTWMTNPDPSIYSSWEEFAKQVFWDYQLGEVFIMPTDFFANGWPGTFRVVPPWMVNVEMKAGRREYTIGRVDVTADILHIRYKSTTDGARGVGPLEAGGARMVAAGILQRYVSEIAETGGRPIYWVEVERRLTKSEADDALAQWIESRQRNLGKPALVSGGAKLNSMPVASAKDMALLELAQFTESRIAIMLGVPPFLVGLPSGGDSMTYSNVSSLFDFHDRASLRPKAKAVMAALSGWALPRGQSAELNRDEYTRPAFNERATGYKTLADAGVALGEPVVTASEIRTMERLNGTPSAGALTGGDGTP